MTEQQIFYYIFSRGVFTTATITVYPYLRITVGGPPISLMDVRSSMVRFIPRPQVGGSLQVYGDCPPPLLHLKMKLMEMCLHVIEAALVCESV